MPITPQQIQRAERIQHAAAHDPNSRVRVVAGPGTGKSFVIEERVYWLVSNGASATGIFVVSFTRAASRDLKARIQRYCTNRGLPVAGTVSVTTLHSLALRILRAAGLLTAYPTEPMVMDHWELENIYDAEFSRTSGATPARCGEIRREHEAFWSTGVWGPPNYIPPDPPVTRHERASFRAFHLPRAQTYSCVLPGEIIRQCLESIAAGTLDPVNRLGLEHLVVDEYQDLNPADIEFVDSLTRQGVHVFIAGDDDQSIYSFRYASPQGIQSFPAKYQGAGDYTLNDCFRCTPNVVAAALTLIVAHPLPNRIQKNLRSLYARAAPPISGFAHRWRFQHGGGEARAIADSCLQLIQAGVSPNEILILISNRRILERGLRAAFDAARIPYEAPRADIYRDSHEGRLTLALLRIVCDADDYVAYRTILGLQQGVGSGTCNAVADKVVRHNLNFRALFFAPLPQGVFNRRELAALAPVRNLIGGLTAWTPNDTLSQRDQGIRQALAAVLGGAAVQAWASVIGNLPQDMTLSETRDYLWADTDEQGAEILTGAYQRLGQQVPAGGLLPPRVRMMTMHGAKGLSAQVVFIPGLEEEILPGQWRRPYPGLILEAARLLYVSISRARAACVVSYAGRRAVYGRPASHAPSRFTGALAGPFTQRHNGLTQHEAQAIAGECRLL